MKSSMLCFSRLVFVMFLTAVVAKPLQQASSEPPVSKFDTLGVSLMGSNKVSRSTKSLEIPRSLLDTLGNANVLRSLDSIGGNNYLRSLDSLGNGNVLRDLDAATIAKLNRAVDAISSGGNFLRLPPELSSLDYRTLDSLGGGNLLRSIEANKAYNNFRHSGKRLDALSGLTLGHQKRTFDEVDRTAFDGFNKRNFDEIDRVGFDDLTSST